MVNPDLQSKHWAATLSLGLSPDSKGLDNLIESFFFIQSVCRPSIKDMSSEFKSVQDDSHGLLGKHNDVDLKQCGYGLARDTHLTGGPPTPMVWWRLVHHLGLGFRVSLCM